MRKEMDLSQYRIGIETTPIELETAKTFEEDVLPDVAKHLRDVVLEYNFDTFSFTTDLIERAEASGKPLAEEFVSWIPDSQELADKFGGTNCTGMSLVLKSRMEKESATGLLVPSYGNYLITEQADEYVGIRTTDIVGFVQKKEGKAPVFLAPGLTVDKPMFIRQGYQVESFGNRYVVTDVRDREFHVLRLDKEGESRERIFHYEEVTNPEASMQKNLPRARTRYQVTRQHQDGSRDFVTFDFPRKSFRVSIGGKEEVYNIGEFQNFLALNKQRVADTFQNANVPNSLQVFSENISEIKEQLLLPEIQTILSQTWRSS